jgi:SnoaL-like protein
MERKLIIQTFD